MVCFWFGRKELALIRPRRKHDIRASPSILTKGFNLVFVLHPTCSQQPRGDNTVFFVVHNTCRIMKNSKIERLIDKDPELCQRLKQWCYDLNGCCQEVHKGLGPFLNEYMYQDALEIVLEERQVVPFTREYYFSVEFHGKRINQKHFVDFYVKEKAFIECKAAEKLCSDHRQQLWNYMRLTKTRIGILWNFAPTHDQSEHYYLDVDTDTMYIF